ncbi:MAG: hypothetical protein WBY94_24890, partial [Polyangiaceae bacterium]
LLQGSPLEILDGYFGPVGIFEAGTLVAYRLRWLRRTRLFVFRTLSEIDGLAAAIPGVRPRVRLLLALRCPGRIRLAGVVFSHFAAVGRDPSSLPDAFYLRMGAAIGGRLPDPRALVSLAAAVEDSKATVPRRRTRGT